MIQPLNHTIPFGQKDGAFTTKGARHSCKRMAPLMQKALQFQTNNLNE